MLDRTIISALAALCLVVGGCRREEPKFATPRLGEIPQREPMRIFLSETKDKPNELNAMSEVSPIRVHYAIYKTTDLMRGKEYKFKFRLFDPDGKLNLDATAFSYTPDVDGYVYCPFPTSGAAAEKGKWKWELQIEGAGRLEKEFTVLSPTKDELDELAKYEAAREAVFFGFSKRWLAHEDSFFAKGPGNAVQITGVKYSSEVVTLSPADKLNGLQYKGSAMISFDLYRTLPFQTFTWNEWKDTVRPSGYTEQYLRQFAAMFISSPEQYANMKGYGFTYEFEMRDGNWLVHSDTGDEFLNNRQTATGSERPVPFTQKEIKTVMPYNTPRSLAQERAAQVTKDNNVTLSDTERQTMDAIRGRKRN